MDSQNQNPFGPADGQTPTPGTPVGPTSLDPMSRPVPPTGGVGPVPPLPPTPAPEQPTAPTATEPPPTALEQVAGTFSAVMGGIFSWLIFPAAVVLILHNFVFQAYHVLGTSMVPTLHDTDYLIISKIGYTEALVGRVFNKDTKYIPDRGQVIVFRYPKDLDKVFVKRVIGLPGDRVVIKNGAVTVFNKDNPNGFNPDSTYEAKDTVTLIDTDETVQAGNVFVIGDNRSAGGSFDSREWGELPSSYIIGNAVLRLLPLDKVRTL